MPFVRSVQAAPQPLCVLATNTQLKQLQLCCTDPHNFSVLCIDPTFNLGSFFVTPMVFLHQVFITKRTKKHPLFLGPMLIHQRMNTEAYSYFAYQIQILCPALRHIQAIGTDGEVALTTAFENAFPGAIHLRCFKHFRDNCESKLRDLNFSSFAQQEILADIFGLDDPEQRQLGLVDATNVSDFAAKLKSLEPRWNRIEMKSRKAFPGEVIVPQFHSWFVKEKSNIMKKNMIKSVRISARLGDPPSKFYTNASESANNVLKIKIERKPQSLTNFVEHVQELIHTYEKNLERAFYRRGDLRVAKLLPEFEQKKQEIMIKMITNASSDISLLLDTEHDSEESDTGDVGCSSIIDKDKELSVSYQPLVESIHEDTLRAIWSKAKSLVNDSTLIVPVPGSSSTSYHRMVASTTGSTPHLVTTPTKFTGQFKCDAQCPMYATYKMCSHTIAVAEVTGKLAEFVKWIVKQKCTPNITNLSMIGMPKGAGQKGGMPKYTRKRKKSDAAQPKKIIDRLSGYSNSEATAPHNITYAAGIHSQQVNVQGQGASAWSVSHMPTGTVAVSNPLTFHSDTTHMYYPIPGYTISPSVTTQFGVLPSPSVPTQFGVSPSPSVPTQFGVSPYPATGSSTNSVVSPYPFTLKLLTSRIQICQGCRISFHPDNDQPPHDLVVCRKECRPYRTQNGQMKTPSTPSNSHYHLNLQCIRAAAPSFMPSELVIPEDVLANLTDVHKGYVFGMLGIQVP